MPFFFVEYYDKRKKKDYHHNMWSENRESAIKTVKRTVGNEEIKILSSEGETSRERLYKAWIDSFGVSKRDLEFPYWLSDKSIKDLMLIYLKKGYGWLTGRARADAIRNIKNIVIYKEDRKSRSRNKYNFKREKLYLDALEESIEILNEDEDGKKRENS